MVARLHCYRQGLKATLLTSFDAAFILASQCVLDVLLCNAIQADVTLTNKL